MATPNPNMTRLMDQARMRLPGALDAAILVELSSVMKDFLSETNVWLQDVTFTAAPNDSPLSYSLYPFDGEATRLMKVKDASGRQVPANMLEPGVVTLQRAPAQEETYTATFALSSPTTNSYPECPEWVLSKHYNIILDGLLGRMMSQIAKPYTSPAIAAMHLRKFRQGISLARTAANRENTYGAQRWRFPKTFA